MSKCFCHFNGYEVKDAKARSEIEQLNLNKANNTDIEHLNSIKADNNDVNLMKADLQRSINVEKERINNLTNLNEGSTTGDAELQDIRIGYNGKNYVSAGESVRNQILDIHNCLDEIYKGLTLYDGYVGSNGVIVNNASNWKYTDLIPIYLIENIDIPMWASANTVSFYDKYSKYISGIGGTGNYNNTGEKLTNLLNAPDNARYVRFSISWGTPYTIKLKDGFENILKYLELNMNVDFKNITPDFNVDFNYNIAIHDDGTEGNYGGWNCSNYIEIDKSFTHITYETSCYHSSGIKLPPVLFFDKDKNIIASDSYDVTISGYTKKIGADSSTVINKNCVKIPDNAIYVRCNYFSGNANTTCNNLYLILCNNPIYSYSDLFIDNKSIKEFMNLSSTWMNKKCAFLGDSITDGVGVSKTYRDYLQTLLSIVPYSYGSNGAKMGDLYYQAQELLNEQSQNIDCIFIFAGTNDFYGNIPIGEWFTESSETIVINSSTNETTTRTKRSFIENTNTFKGCINKLISYLKVNYPTKQIILMTPIHRGYAKFSETNIQYSELYQNGIGLYFEEYIKAIKEASEIWSIPLINLYEKAGLFPAYREYGEYFKDYDNDMLHPNELGHQRLGKTIAESLKGIPSDFTI